jgi:uncharacterized membrane protein
MSYQMGGYTVYLDPGRISALDVHPEDALRAVLTGGALKRSKGGQDGARPASADDDTADARQQAG